MITRNELTQLRADVLETLIGTCTVLRPTRAVDAHYLPGETWGTAVASARCRIDPFNRQDSSGLVAEREANRAYFRLTLAWDADIADGDRVVSDGMTYELLQLHETHDGRIVKRALLAKVEGQ